MKLFGLNDSHWQKIRWWKRYYTFEVDSTLIHCYFASDCYSSRHSIKEYKIDPGDEVVFDYKKKEVAAFDTVSMDYSNARVLKLFKFKYLFNFTEAATIDKYYYHTDYDILVQSVNVVPSKTYVLNTFLNTLKELV